MKAAGWTSAACVGLTASATDPIKSAATTCASRKRRTVTIFDRIEKPSISVSSRAIMARAVIGMAPESLFFRVQFFSEGPLCREQNDWPCSAARRPAAPRSWRLCAVLCRIVRPATVGASRTGMTMTTPDHHLSAEQSRQIAETIREEIARRRMSRQALAEQAKLSLSTLEKVLGGRRPFTLATTVRLEQALGVSLRKATPSPAPIPVNGDVSPDGLGSYSRRAVARLEGTYLTLRPSFGVKDAIYAYHTEIAWDAAASALLFKEGERLDIEFSQYGEVAVPNESGFIYLVTNRHGQHRVITISRPTISGAMYGITPPLLAGRAPLLTPIAAPIALLPIKSIANPSVGRIALGDPNYALYRQHLRRTVEEPFALFMQG